MKIFRRLLSLLLVGFILINIVSAFQAYKLTRFYDNGDTKVPVGKQTFWYKTKAILFGVNIPKSKNLVHPDSVFTTFFINSDDNLNLECWYEKQPQAVGTVILFHGHGGSKAGVISESNYFRSIGYNVLMVDFRAHGGSDGNICTIGFKESVDVKAAYDYIASKGEKNICLWGISLGAATIIKTIHDYNIHPQKIILEMPFGSLLQAVKGRVRLMGLPEEPISSLLTFWGGIEHGFNAFNYKPCEYSKAITCPVLLQWGAKDPRVTKKEIDCIYEHLSAKDKKLVIYPNAAHESLCQNSPEEWENEISSFLNQ